jgi:hypothetical protein
MKVFHIDFSEICETVCGMYGNVRLWSYVN